MTTLASPTQHVRTGELNSASFAPRGENICKIYLDKVVNLKGLNSVPQTVDLTKHRETGSGHTPSQESAQTFFGMGIHAPIKVCHNRSFLRIPRKGHLDETSVGMSVPGQRFLPARAVSSAV
jgi:hypothetical protein